MAFVAFLAGMVAWVRPVFRHQVESTIRHSVMCCPGCSSVSTAMLVLNPPCLPEHLARGPCCRAGILLGARFLLVAVIVRLSGIDAPTAFATALILAWAAIGCAADSR